MSVIGISLEIIWDKIASRGLPSLSKEELDLLSETPGEFINKALLEISTEIDRLSKNKKSLNPVCLYWSFRIVAFFRESSAFKLVKKLCGFSAEKIGKAVGVENFAYNELCSLIALTADGKWKEIDKELRNTLLDEDVKRSYAGSLLIMYARNEIDRTEFVDYCKGIFISAIRGDIDDGLLISELISICLDIWPGECLEEIRELFGLELVNGPISIYAVLDKFDLGKDKCLEILEENMEKHIFLTLEKSPAPDDEEVFNKFENAYKQMIIAMDEVLSPIRYPDRNDPCSCNSGLKYKKCCGKSAEDVRVESFTISYEPGVDPDRKELTLSEKNAVVEISDLLDENPKKAHKLAEKFLKNHPNLCVARECAYVACKELGRNIAAMDVLRETIEKFSRSLYSKLEYANYIPSWNMLISA